MSWLMKGRQGYDTSYRVTHMKEARIQNGRRGDNMTYLNRATYENVDGHEKIAAQRMNHATGISDNNCHPKLDMASGREHRRRNTTQWEGDMECVSLNRACDLPISPNNMHVQGPDSGYYTICSIRALIRDTMQLCSIRALIRG
jgi:hypothetical protein